jgi:hypothetical protein
MSLMKQLMISIGRRRTTTQFVVTAAFAQLPGQLMAQRSWSFIKLLLLLILLLLLFLVGRPAGRRNHLHVVMVVTAAAASVVNDNDVAALWAFKQGTTWQGADPYPDWVQAGPDMQGPCHWTGVSCNSLGQVSEVSLHQLAPCLPSFSPSQLCSIWI